MGTFTPALIALQAADMIASHGNQQKAGKAQIEAQEAQAALQTQQLAAAQAVDKQRRDNDLRTAMASRRALLGAGGLGSADGSGRALLLGLTKSADEEAAVGGMDSRFRLDSLNARLGAQRQLNLLEMSDNRRRTAIGLVPKTLQLGNSIYTEFLK
jgi:hypothetical protein